MITTLFICLTAAVLGWDTDVHEAYFILIIALIISVIQDVLIIRKLYKG